MFRVRMFCCLVTAISISACSTTAPVKRAPQAGHVYPAAPVAKTQRRVDLQNGGRVVQLLQAQHAEWAGTRHSMGGMSKRGVDCSAFVYITLREKLGYQPPRTTQAQSRWGEPVDLNRLQPADLVFFRTGIKSRHVGIYMGNRQFLHASSSKGVKVSSLDDHYWRDRFWQARRPAPTAVTGESGNGSGAVACAPCS